MIMPHALVPLSETRQEVPVLLNSGFEEKKEPAYLSMVAKTIFCVADRERALESNRFLNLNLRPTTLLTVGT